ncbi:MAG TPA: TerC family protein [Pelagibacterium sp.]|uniref:TerC family protein n=1 Tax=Pelagibacterium sp. TaxID=1967288 RepID=UPI002B7966DF|nr:TerC family protein [Pelagibacterium sp.]HWJ86780.1 TerC family protein [Pelagibacterium sp.]
MLEFVFEPAFWASLFLLIGMEVALGADNVVFISTLAAKLPERHRQRILQIGLAMAAVFRLLLLAAIVWVLGLQRTAFTLAGWSPSWRDLILLGGGFFLVYKAVTELHLLVEPVPRQAAARSAASSPALAIVQIIFINAVFSVDSIITAIGLTSYVEAMAVAVVVSIIILYFAASAAGALIARHPSIKALALGFLFMIGAVLIADGLGLDVARPYLYAAMGFAVLVLAVTTLMRREFSASGAKAATPGSRGLQGRTEPTLEPAIDPIQTAPELRVEPVLPAERAEDSETGADPALAMAGEGGVDQPDAENDVFDGNSDVAPLGEGDMPVQRSRRKRPVLRRRPERLRTARRRE